MKYNRDAEKPSLVHNIQSVSSAWSKRSTSRIIRYHAPCLMPSSATPALQMTIADKAAQVHKLCQASADKILNDFQPNLMIAIGGGGYVPARILRSFLKRPGSANIPIQAIGLSLYETLTTSDPVETPGTKVTRTQWLDFSSLEISNLVGKNILIVDEVDDTRTTLEYAVKELEKDVETAAKKLGREGERARFCIFVLHVSRLFGGNSERKWSVLETAGLTGRGRTRTNQRRDIYPKK